MKKAYESPNLFEVWFEVEERLMVSVTDPDQDIDSGSVKLPSINIFG